MVIRMSAITIIIVISAICPGFIIKIIWTNAIVMLMCGVAVMVMIFTGASIIVSSIVVQSAGVGNGGGCNE